MRPGRCSASALLLASVACLAVGAPAWASPAPPPLATIVLPNVGPGFAVVRQGPLDAAQFAAAAPDPSAVAAALGADPHSVRTYERVWTDTGMHNEVQDLVVALATPSAAEAFRRGAQRSISAGKIVSTGAVATIAGAVRTTYFASTTQVGVGQAITMRSGPYVVILSMFSADSGNQQPITAADALTIARAQHAAVAQAAARLPAPRAAPRHRSPWWSALALAFGATAVLVLFAVYRNRYGGGPPGGRDGPVRRP